VNFGWVFAAACFIRRRPDGSPLVRILELAVWFRKRWCGAAWEEDGSSGRSPSSGRLGKFSHPFFIAHPPAHPLRWNDGGRFVVLSLVGFSGVFFWWFFFGWFFVSFSLWFRAEFELLVCSCDVGPACTWVAVGAEFCPCRAIDPGRMGTPGGRCQGGWCLSDPLLHLICPGSVSDGLLLAMTVCRDTRC
jgi:hypothetical protein